MLPSLLIVFREVFEAGLIVGIVMAVTAGVAGRGRWVAHWRCAARTRWVIHIISSAHKRLPLLTQHQTYRCIALRVGFESHGARAIPTHEQHELMRRRGGRVQNR